MNELKGLFQTLARYSQTMNGQIYTACSLLSDDERRRDRGAWFRSIHGTLNHGLLADKVWLGRFTSEPFIVPALDSELFATWNELQVERARVDEDLIAWVDNLDPERLRETLRFQPMSQPQLIETSLWLAVAHVWNHATHHRGQVTTMMNAVGADSGVTDLLALAPVKAFVSGHPL